MLLDRGLVGFVTVSLLLRHQRNAIGLFRLFKELFWKKGDYTNSSCGGRVQRRPLRLWGQELEPLRYPQNNRVVSSTSQRNSVFFKKRINNGEN